MPSNHPPHHQLILFGPPGTSKSYRARKEHADAIGAHGDHIISAMFHPDYSYGEFSARLMPVGTSGGINYEVHAGPFIRALALAFHGLAEGEGAGKAPGNVLLLIDEINRGNCAEIFGDIFQLLDREADGWSSFDTSVSDLVIRALRNEMLKLDPEAGGARRHPLPTKVKALLESRRLQLPPNLYLVGTMNTSDESVYFMDSAFKRRWHFEFRSVGFADVEAQQRDAPIAGTTHTWSEFLGALNDFILDKCTSPKMDDKLVGPWFIKARLLAPRVLSLGEMFPTEVAYISDEAAGVHILSAEGIEHSAKFEQGVLALANLLPIDSMLAVLALAGHDAAERPTLTAIDSNVSGRGNPYYRQHLSAAPKGGATMGAFDFVGRLRALPVSIPQYEIDHAAIAGKLMLYLWDNVFDRDKTPLARLLGVDRKDLRTFGQFTDRVTDFIEATCKHAKDAAAARAAAATTATAFGASSTAEPATVPIAPSGSTAANDLAAPQNAGR